MVELAWMWLRWQPDSALSIWFRARVGANRRADQENHDRGTGSQAAGRLVALRQGWRHSGRSEDEDGVRRTFIFSPQFRSTVGGRRRNPRTHEGAVVKNGPAARNSFSRMLGSWLGIRKSHRIRGWQGVHPVSQIGVHRDQKLVVDFPALIRGFRMPALCRRLGPDGGRRSKAS